MDSPFWLDSSTQILAAIISVVVGGLLGLRAKIQAAAWEKIYLQKREEILAFLRHFNRFALLVLSLGEVRETKGQLNGRQGNTLLHTLDQLWPEGNPARESKEALFAQSFPKLSPERLFDQPTPEEEQLFDASRNMMYNLILQEVQEIAHQTSMLQATLIVSIRNPNVAQRGHAIFGEYYAKLLSPPGVAGFDFDSFPSQWAERLAPVRLALRRDLRISAKSLAAAHRISWVWYFSGMLRNPRKFIVKRWTTYVARPNFDEGEEE